MLLQGRPAPPNARWSVPVTLTLRYLPNSALFEYAAVTDNSGYFTVTLTSASGEYAWYVKNSQTLANAGTFQLLYAVQNLEVGTLRAGDATNDNCVRVADFAILKNTFAKSHNDPGFDPRADFNADDQVSIVDFNLLKAAFGLCGASPP